MSVSSSIRGLGRRGKALLMLAVLMSIWVSLAIPGTAHAQTRQNEQERVQEQDRSASERPRLVSTAGSLTEILYALDLQSHLVGVDTTSRWPEQVAELPTVGYQRALSAEGILSLSPDRILATADAGPAEVLQQLRDAGVQIDQFKRDYTMPGLYQRIRDIARSLGYVERAEELIADIQLEYQQARSLQQGYPTPGVVLLLGVEAGSSMASGSDTAADAMISLAGASNPLTYSGYKPVNAEALIQAAPDHLLVVQHDADRSDEDVIESVMALPGVELTPAGQSGRITILDGLRFLGFGPRTAGALKDLSAVLHEQAHEP